MDCLHTFVVCAYGESAFLESCIRSLRSQTVSSNIIIATSTPNGHISAVAEKYDLPIHVNTGEAGITGDWNFGLSLCSTPFATIAHQDDVYEPEFTKRVIGKLQGFKRPLIAFTDYYEIKNDTRIDKSGVLKIKRLMNLGFKLFPRWKFARRRVLSLGNSICCPAVTYAKEVYDGFKFDKNFRFACDWDAWERISREKGAFVYISESLMGHRIHEDSETSRIMADNNRVKEEYAMFRRFWCEFIAKKLSGAYAKNADNNKV